MGKLLFPELVYNFNMSSAKKREKKLLFKKLNKHDYVILSGGIFPKYEGKYSAY